MLAAIMEKTGRAGVATFVMRGKEYLIAIVAENGILRAETMRFKDEIRSPEDIGLPEKAKVPAEQVHHFEQMIAKESAQELPRDELHDQSASALLELVKKKQIEKENVVKSGEAEAGKRPPVDIVEALKTSLAAHKHEPARRRPKHGRSAKGCAPSTDHRETRQWRQVNVSRG